MLTDSGGYQVFSLEPEGRRRRRHVRARPTTAARHHLTPEGAVDVQVDAGRRHPDGARRVPAAAVARPRCVRSAVDRTALWAERARKAFLAARAATTSDQFGIVQGGDRPRPAGRERRADRGRSGSTATRSAGCRWGRTARQMLPGPRGRARAPARPTGPGTSWAWATRSGMVEAVARGVDMFDCVLPTRLARHGTILTVRGAAQPAQPPLRRRRRAARPGLRVPGLRPLVAGLPAPPAVGGRAHRPPAADPAQRGLDVRAGRPDPGRDRGGDAGARCGPRWPGAGPCRTGRPVPGARMGDREAAGANLVRLPMEPLLVLAVTLRPAVGAVHPPAAAPGPGPPGAGRLPGAGRRGRPHRRHLRPHRRARAPRT